MRGRTEALEVWSLHDPAALAAALDALGPDRGDRQKDSGGEGHTVAPTLAHK
ncbi:hypothetical protein [Breoghania sp.]|uniref:hypothetical protein n=1 Tax=Breoghania sp. TaxID=2065378 RepID=UPI002636F526|nr:hypothetical protein [Breoghania sp.]MDJ0933622.1 hypothetical protein [Breoghania sp.]